MSIFYGTGNLENTDLYQLHHVVQNTLISPTKDVIIGTLRNFYAQDTTFHFVQDEWGYPKTPNHSNLPVDAGIEDDLTTRIFIGEAYRPKVRFYPSIIVKSGGINSTPLSLNRNRGTIRHDITRVVDNEGREKQFLTPGAFVFTGAWTGQIYLEISAKSIGERDDIIRLCMLLFEDIAHDDLIRSGIVVQRQNVSSPTEIEDGNEKIYKSTISLDIRTEWRREIPIDNLIDRINFCIELGRIDIEPPEISPNLTITGSLDLIEKINEL